jgi:hypothetical protein
MTDERALSEQHCGQMSALGALEFLQTKKEPQSSLMGRK